MRINCNRISERLLYCDVLGSFDSWLVLAVANVRVLPLQTDIAIVKT
jgi:hypothetical protein